MNCVRKSATFSECGKYRYSLSRIWGESPPMVVIGHNPSKAGQLRCPACKVWVIPAPSVYQMCPAGHHFERPDDGSDDADDPTIRRCMGFARASGHGGLLMLNCCAWIDTDPAGLALLEDPVGRGNNASILEACTGAGLVVAAWGSLAAKSKSQAVRQRPAEVLRMLTVKSWGGLGIDVHAFKVSKDGNPSHPLYLPAALSPVLYRRAS